MGGYRIIEILPGLDNIAAGASGDELQDVGGQEDIAYDGLLNQNADHTPNPSTARENFSYAKAAHGKADDEEKYGLGVAGAGVGHLGERDYPRRRRRRRG